MALPDGTLPCAFCGELPEMAHYTRNPHQGTSYAMKCVSQACAMRVVETHRCGDQESCRDVWNAGRK